MAALASFCTDVGTPKNLKSDRAKELVGRNTEFNKYERKRHINLTYAEPYRKNQIWPVDLEMRELKKRVRNKMVQKNVPSRAWDFALTHMSKVMQFIPRTPDISEYGDFDFWDLVWYWPGSKPTIDEKDRQLGEVVRGLPQGW